MTRIYKPLTQETKDKISKAGKGRILSTQARKNISNGHKGLVSPNKGKTFSKEWREKMSISHKGLNTWIKGTKQTKEHMLKKSAPKGDKNWNWKGGINPINDTIRKSFEMKVWKRACLERDDFTCQKTGQRGGDLVVHHINNFADFPELRTSLSNGITLSKESHIKFHKIYGKKNNTQEQLEEFLTNKNE